MAEHKKERKKCTLVYNVRVYYSSTISDLGQNAPVPTTDNCLKTLPPKIPLKKVH